MTTANLPEHTLVFFLDEETGLGHIRVTESLEKSIPSWVEKVFIRELDEVLVKAHGAGSSSLGKFLQEQLQYGLWQYITTPLLRLLFWITSARYAQKVIQQVSKHQSADHILFICTHFAPAHRLSYFLPFWRLRYPKKTFHLIVQVTDDSPQYIWYVPGADLTLVPSRVTKIVLEKYAKRLRMSLHSIQVSPYPVSSFLNVPLSKAECEDRQMQLDPLHPALLHICIPVSGAVVGTGFLLELMKLLHQRIPKTFFHVVCRETDGAQPFLQEMQKLPFIKTYTGFRPADVVDVYERLYRSQIISLEITKPSEQAFKTLLSPATKGGVSMLFTEPVGRQEKDNLNYMRREFLLPSEEVQGEILAGRGDQSKLWRGYTLSGKVEGSVAFIKTLFEGGEFLRNVTCLIQAKPTEFSQEDANHQFWEKVSGLLTPASHPQER